jgi:hypothetical protein
MLSFHLIGNTTSTLREANSANNVQDRYICELSGRNAENCNSEVSGIKLFMLLPIKKPKLHYVSFLSATHLKWILHFYIKLH